MIDELDLEGRAQRNGRRASASSGVDLVGGSLPEALVRPEPGMPAHVRPQPRLDDRDRPVPVDSPVAVADAAAPQEAYELGCGELGPLVRDELGGRAELADDFSDEADVKLILDTCASAQGAELA